MNRRDKFIAQEKAKLIAAGSDLLDAGYEAEMVWLRSRACDPAEFQPDVAWCYDRHATGIRITIHGTFIRITRQELLELAADAATWLVDNPE